MAFTVFPKSCFGKAQINKAPLSEVTQTFKWTGTRPGTLRTPLFTFTSSPEHF